jgi:Fe(3+) dicitrate transport protein
LWGFCKTAEARYLKRYRIDNRSAFDWSQILPITKHGLQGPGSSGSDANFNLANNEFPFMPINRIIYSQLKFCCFGEYFQNFLQLFYHPGFRFEKNTPKQKDLTAKSIWT